MESPQAFSDPAFLVRLRAKEPAAIEAVVHAHAGQILRAARAAGLNQEVSRDVAQAVFLTFIQGVDRFEGRSQIRTWLFGILFRKIAETRRALRRETEQDDIEGVMEARFAPNGTWCRPPAAADRQLLDSEIRRHLADCLAEVPDRQRMAFVLREVEGLDTVEICKALDVTDTNLGVLLFRVRNRLRECLENRGLKG